MDIGQSLLNLINSTGFVQMTWQQAVMIIISCVLMYLAIVKKYEPLLLLPIAFGMLMVNLPLSGVMNQPVYDSSGHMTSAGGLIYYLYQGVKLGIYPPLIFLGVGAMTDFGPLIAKVFSARLYWHCCLDLRRMKPVPSGLSVARTAQQLST